MIVKLRVIKGQDTSYNGKNGHVSRYSVTCSDPEETLLDNVDVIMAPDLGNRVFPAFKGKTVDFTVEAIRDGFRRIEVTGVPKLP
jgi:hypothetical protein